MNEWLTRGLISVTAGALSTFAIVKSAGQSSDEKPDPKTSRSERSGRKKKSKNTQTSPSQGAALPESGLDLETWWSGVKRSGVRAGQHVGKILNGETPAPEERSKESEEQSEPQKKRPSSKGGAKVSHDGYATLKDEAAYWAKSKVKETVVKKTGLDGVMDAAQQQAERVKAHGEDLKEKINDSNLSEWVDGVKDTGASVAQSVKEAGDTIQKNIQSADVDFDELKNRASEKAKRLGVWLEGPGALDYSATEKNEAHVIEAQFAENEQERPADKETQTSEQPSQSEPSQRVGPASDESEDE